MRVPLIAMAQPIVNRIRRTRATGTDEFPGRAWNLVRQQKLCPFYIDPPARQISLRTPPNTWCASLWWLPPEDLLNLSDWLRLLLHPQPARCGAHASPGTHPKSSSILQARQRRGISGSILGETLPFHDWAIIGRGSQCRLRARVPRYWSTTLDEPMLIVRCAPSHSGVTAPAKAGRDSNFGNLRPGAPISAKFLLELLL